MIIDTSNGEHFMVRWILIDYDDYDDDNDNKDDQDGVHPKSHKHFIPYMGFCASIWDSVRHHSFGVDL